MDIHEFLKKCGKTIYPVFKTNKELKVDTYVWFIGTSPYNDKKQYTIPEGTLLIVHPYSNFGDGYSMRPLHPRKIFKGKGSMNRWFKCLFSDMEFVEHRTT